jgi:hypothetical protein
MTNEELCGAIKYLGISQGELARRLGNRPETISRWINGKSPKSKNVPGPAAAAISLWVEQKKAEEPQPVISEDAL